jgi:hypothetical protein
MLLEQVMSYYSKDDGLGPIDGCYLSVNAQKLLFEEGFGDRLCSQLTKTLRESLAINV